MPKITLLNWRNMKETRELSPLHSWYYKMAKQKYSRRRQKHKSYICLRKTVLWRCFHREQAILDSIQDSVFSGSRQWHIRYHIGDNIPQRFTEKVNINFKTEEWGLLSYFCRVTQGKVQGFMFSSTECVYQLPSEEKQRTKISSRESRRARKLGA